MTLIFVIVGWSLCWQKTITEQNSRSSNPDETKTKSLVFNWKSIPANYTKTKALNALLKKLYLSKHAD